MKTTLKKTMAALSAAAVVAASAAVMAVPTSAAGVSLTMGSKAANYQVTLPIGVTDSINSVGFGVTLGEGLTYVDLEASVKKATCLAATNDAGNFVFAPFAYATVPLKAVSGQIAAITVEVSKDAKAGDTFTLSIDGKDSDGVETGDSGVPGGGAGTITIVEDPTEPTTEATTAAPTATPVAATTTTAKVATPTKPAKSTSSPKTGDALPVAGVAVAVAVIGGVALVAKKRK